MTAVGNRPLSINPDLPSLHKYLIIATLFIEAIKSLKPSAHPLMVQNVPEIRGAYVSQWTKKGLGGLQTSRYGDFIAQICVKYLNN